MEQLWIEKYRPQTLDDYVFMNATQRAQIESWVAQGTIPHVLFGGVQGTGKTSLARLLIRCLGVDPADVLDINASNERGIETIREKILPFCRNWPVGDFKIIILDEADALTPDAQRSLKNEMEAYADNVRFILTCNHPNKIIEPIHSRVQSFHFDALDRESFSNRCLEVLILEGIIDPEDDSKIEQDLSTLERFIEITYPDMRKCLGLLQQYSPNGRLQSPDTNAKSKSNAIVEVLENLLQGNTTAARKCLANNLTSNDYDYLYRWLYENLYVWGDTDEQQERAILIIAEGIRDHAIVADPEINMSATLIKLKEL